MNESMNLQLILNDLSAQSDSSRVKGMSNQRAQPLGKLTYKRRRNEKRYMYNQHLFCIYS